MLLLCTLYGMGNNEKPKEPLQDSNAKGNYLPFKIKPDLSFNIKICHRAAFRTLPRTVLQWFKSVQGDESHSGGGADDPPSLPGQPACHQQSLLGQKKRLNNNQY